MRQKEEENNELKKNIKKALLEEKAVTKDFGGSNTDAELTQHEFAQVEQTHEFQKLNTTTYEYMLDRMKKDLISLTLTINDSTESLRSKKQITEEEQRKQMKSREQKLQARYRLDALMTNIDREQAKRQERIMALQLSIRNKEQALQKRIERVKRQHAIAEEAANENKDQNEIEARQKFNIQKIWSQFYMKKMAKEMAKYKEIEDAFQQIRACSGNSDVKEMVTKFMTREETYAQLHKQVGHFERKFEWLRQKNEEKKTRLHQLQIENDNKRKVGEAKPNVDHATPPTSISSEQDANPTGAAEQAEHEYTRLAGELESLRALLDQINDRSKKIELTNDQIGGWTNRVASKIAEHTDDGTYQVDAGLSDRFQWIESAV